MIRIAQTKLIANHTFKSVLNASFNRWLIGVFLVLIVAALFSSFENNQQHLHDVDHYSKDVRDRWEKSPDKHPHRMAHYGYVAFRSKYPLSFFDKGLDSYLGNVIFLEAHRQNSVNFSTASLSSSLLRFGEISAGLILQLLLPLLIFFWGFASISGERENGILRLYLTQGVSWKEILLGKSLGLFGLSLIITLPALIFSSILLFIYQPQVLHSCIFSFLGLSISYLVYCLIMSMIAVGVSARSATSKSALIKLIGFWLLFVLIIPRLSQVAAQAMFPSPSKIEFDAMVEHEIIQNGDSHDPNDPHFQGIKDSLLLTYNVSSTSDLPFNYSGFIMKEGEKLSTEIYRKHQAHLISLYDKQSNVVNTMSILNPYLAIKNISMVFSGTDFDSYQIFKEEAESYRYNLAQTMNNLQIEHISNTTTSSADKNAVISQQYWKDFPPFKHRFLKRAEMIQAISLSAMALCFWAILLVLGPFYFAKNLKAI